MKNLQKNENQVKDLIKLNDELENYFQNTIIPQLFVDANLILRKFTPPTLKQFKLSLDDIGKPFEVLIKNFKYETLLDDMQTVIHSGKVFEKEVKTDDLKWYQMNIIPYIVKDTNKINGVILTFIDITNRVNDMRDLERLNASHETFIYSVSHDLNAPLANIEGLTQDLINTYKSDNSEQRKIVEMIEEAVTNMRSILRELSQITKVKDNYAEKPDVLYFDNIFKEVKLILKDQIDNRNVQINTEFNVPKIKLSRKALRSILYNLLSNAVKYSSPERTPDILIKTESVDGWIQIIVKDNGLGIKEENLEMIFSKFTRIQKEEEGSGIGLYLVKRIVENEEGKIVVESEFGKGTEFKVFLKSKK